jgi:hypothetical protein
MVNNLLDLSNKQAAASNRSALISRPKGGTTYPILVFEDIIYFQLPFRP